MNRYTYTLIREISLHLDEGQEVTPATKISEIFPEDSDTLNWIYTLLVVELTYGFEIPDSLAEKTEMTLNEFGRELARLPRVPELIYPEFHDLKNQLFSDTVKLLRFQSGLEEGTPDEKDQINERLAYNCERLYQITGMMNN